jgi:gentisate 1,2-dioxygenase
VPAGQKLAAAAHKNDAYEEILYGIQGVLTWTVDGTPIEVGPGQALCIPRGAVHRFDNFGDEDVKQLAVISPAIMGPAYFREAAEVISASAGGPPDRQKMMDVFRRPLRRLRRRRAVPRPTVNELQQSQPTAKWAPFILRVIEIYRQ